MSRIAEIILDPPPDFTWSAPSATVWTFSNRYEPFEPSMGRGKLTFRDQKGTEWGFAKTRFETTSYFGLPPLPGGDAQVMAFPAARKDEGYLLTHGAPPNGVFAGQGFLSNYTLVMDLLWPRESQQQYRALYQRDPENKDDAEMFIHDSRQNGIGINSVYHGKLMANRWHRVAISVQAASGAGGVGQMHKFIDGRFVGGHGTDSAGPVSRWALGPEFLLFTDNDGETMPGYVSSIYFIDRNLSMEEIALLGRPHAGGANIPGPLLQKKREKLPRSVDIIAHRGDSCCSPENTLIAIRRAFDRGASAVEVDIQWSADGTIVLMHDETVDRTTNGKGKVVALTLEKLKSFDAGSWFGFNFRGEKIPTLTEALLEAKGRGKLILDVKGHKMGAAIKGALKEAGVGPEAVYIWLNEASKAFDDFQKYLPGTGILWGGMPDSFDESTFYELKKKGIVGFDIDPSDKKVSKPFVMAAQKAGFYVSLYTINDPQGMRESAWLGVDAIETDFPAVLKDMLP
ncbi:MAG: glycerophosphodiester phosphodiesterase family protein [Deltaproteobacteria bacterium]|nr:glycerophosphodiester phosphodiesterase family protein [Deltaproteobacteria bacterium]